MPDEKRILFQSKGFPEFRFLSNFHLCSITDEFGVHYHSVEHMYQCRKATTKEDFDKIYAAKTPNQARIAGQQVDLSPRWHELKDGFMRMAVEYKFAQNSDLKEMLLATDGFELVEFAPWGDTYWGVDKELKGQNRLGKILMKVRDDLKEKK